MGSDTIATQGATEAQSYSAQQGIPPQDPYGVSSVATQQEPQMAVSQGQFLAYPTSAQYPQQLSQYPEYPMPYPLPIWERKACKVCVLALLVFFLNILFFMLIGWGLVIANSTILYSYSSDYYAITNVMALIFCIVAAISTIVIIVSGIVTLVSKQ